MLASAAFVAAALSLAPQAAAHLSLLSIYGSTDVVGHAFGVDIYGKTPRSGWDGDAGSDVAVFEDGERFPQPPCGSTGKLGALDSEAWFSQAQGFGVPTAFPNGSVTFDAFQVNRDGAGDMWCEYSGDASLRDDSWANLTMNNQVPGVDGFKEVWRHNYTIVASFPHDAVCSGGLKGDLCIARCRVGVNARTLKRYRFGGCFAIRLAAKVGGGSSDTTSGDTATPSSAGMKATSRSTDSTVTNTNTNTSSGAGSSSGTGCTSGTNINLTTGQTNKIVKAVVKQMKKAGLVYKSGAKY